MERDEHKESDLISLALHIADDPAYTPDKADRAAVEWISPALWEVAAEILPYTDLCIWMDAYLIETLPRAAARFAREGLTNRGIMDRIGAHASAYPMVREAADEARKILAAEIVDLRAGGLSYREIAERLGISAAMVYRIVRKHTEALPPDEAAARAREAQAAAMLDGIAGRIMESPELLSALADRLAPLVRERIGA